MTATVRSRRWADLWLRLGARGDADAELEEIERRWSEPQRHYHTLAHLDACLDVFELVRGACERPDEAELALWLHDVVWTPFGESNEAESAQYARALCWRAQLAHELGERVAGLILATRHDGTPLMADAAVVADVDLAIFGGEAGTFDWYEDAVRREYADVPDEGFRTGRRRLLESFLARPFIYATAALRDALEERARGNIARSLERLGPANRAGPL